MRYFWTVIAVCCLCIGVRAQIDMQAPVGSDEGLEAYNTYVDKQSDYYLRDASPKTLRKQRGDTLFQTLNTLLGSTCLLARPNYSYNSLRFAYVNVDRDLNTEGNIIGFYDGSSFSGTWDNGYTWNREHVWPQSKGASKDECMGYDMQSVRPALKEENGSRGSKAYGETGSYYDPGALYRGDAARIILYDYVLYGTAGGYSNGYYNGKAQLMTKLGTGGVFESVRVLLKWHMHDPVSLTEMVRNDGAQDYQGNRNPFIDYPALAVYMLQDAGGIRTYTVKTTGVSMWPDYRMTTADGFVAYLGAAGEHPASEEVQISGATYQYDANSGRLEVTGVTNDMIVSLYTSEGVDNIQSDKIRCTKALRDGQMYIVVGNSMYSITGQKVKED